MAINGLNFDALREKDMLLQSPQPPPPLRRSERHLAQIPEPTIAAAEAFPEHMGALSVGIDHGYGKVEGVREQHAKELQREKKNDEAKAEAAAAPCEAAGGSAPLAVPQVWLQV